MKTGLILSAILLLVSCGPKDVAIIETSELSETSGVERHETSVKSERSFMPDMSLYSADMAANIGLIAGVEQSDAEQIIWQWFSIGLNDKIRPKIMHDTINIGDDKILIHARIENMRGNPITDKEAMVIIKNEKVLEAGLRVICRHSTHPGWKSEPCS